MKFKKRSQSKATAFALTSMLDVIFLLLCFFVTVSVFSQCLPTACQSRH